MMIYMIVALVAAAALGGLYFQGHQAGKHSQWQTDQPIIAKAQNDAALEKDANLRLQGDLGKIQAEAQACSAQVAELGKVGQDVRTAVDRAIADSRNRSSQTDAAIAKLRAAAVAPPAGTPQQQCDAARAILGDLADAVRQNQQPAPIAAPAPAKPAAPSHKTALPPAVRSPSK